MVAKYMREEIMLNVYRAKGPGGCGGDGMCMFARCTPSLTEDKETARVKMVFPRPSIT